MRKPMYLAMSAIAVSALLLTACGGGNSSGSSTPAPASSSDPAPASSMAPASTSAAETPTPTPTPELAPPGPVTNVKVKLTDQGPDAQLVVTFKIPDSSPDADLPSGYRIEGDLNDFVGLPEATFGVTKSMLGKKLQFTIVAESDSGDSEPVAASFAVPQTALEVDYSSYSELSDREWQLLLKNPDSKMLETYVIYGEISQFDAATGPDTFRADALYYNAGSDLWIDGENCFFTGDEKMLSDFVEDDIVKMWVTSMGSYSYDTQAGGSTTVPLFMVDKIELAG